MSAFEPVGEAEQNVAFDASTRPQAVAADAKSEKRSYRKMLWAVGGFLCFGLSVIGAILPIIPTTPFLLAAAFFFARSSEKLNAWFKSTKLYRTVLDGYVKKRAMSAKAKMAILVPVTLLLGLSFALMANVPVGRMTVGAIWVAHIIYFGFVVKTEKA